MGGRTQTRRGYVNLITSIIINFELQSFCIATRYLAESHTAPVLGKVCGVGVHRVWP